MSDVFFAFIEFLNETDRSVMLLVNTLIYSKKLWLDQHKATFEFSDALKPTKQEGDDTLPSENIKIVWHIL